MRRWFRKLHPPPTQHSPLARLPPELAAHLLGWVAQPQALLQSCRTWRALGKDAVVRVHWLQQQHPIHGAADMSLVRWALKWRGLLTLEVWGLLPATMQHPHDLGQDLDVLLCQVADERMLQLALRQGWVDCVARVCTLLAGTHLASTRLPLVWSTLLGSCSDDPKLEATPWEARYTQACWEVMRREPWILRHFMQVAQAEWLHDVPEPLALILRLSSPCLASNMGVSSSLMSWAVAPRPSPLMSHAAELPASVHAERVERVEATSCCAE